MYELGPERFDVLSAKICQTIANLPTMLGMGGEGFSVKDFLVDFNLINRVKNDDQSEVAPEDEATEDEDEINAGIEKMRMYTQLMGGTVQAGK